MLLSEILDTIKEKKVNAFREVDIKALAYDSRQVGPSGAFFCIKGLVTDGHLYAADAIKRGASALFIQRDLDRDLGEDVVLVKVPDTREALALCSAHFYGDPSAEMKLVGVTGTNGKTTTTYLVENILKKAGVKTGLIGTIENHIGDKVEPVVRTTPESLDLQRLLRRMSDDNVETVVMETSSHALELQRVSGCRFNVVVFTNLTQDHLDFHISIEEYFGAKRRLFEGDEFGKRRKAVINLDDRFGAILLQETRLPSLSFGIDRNADIKGNIVEVSSRGNSFTIEHLGKSIPVETKLQGRFNVYNCLAATGVALEFGTDEGSIIAGFEGLEGVPGRFENIDCGQDFTVIVDYAHTPDGIRNLLEACREVTSGRVIIVVGCGGDRDRSKRPKMGLASGEMSDICVITSDNPRSENPEAILEMMLEGIRSNFPADKYLVEVNRRKAILSALGLAGPGDLVVVAGKGHESGQIFADKVVPFDDRQVVREGLMEVLDEEC